MQKNKDNSFNIALGVIIFLSIVGFAAPLTKEEEMMRHNFLIRIQKSVFGSTEYHNYEDVTNIRVERTLSY